MLSSPYSTFLFIFFLLVFVNFSAANRGCTRKCGKIHIRFPFQLKNSNSDDSDNPDPRFHLSCGKHKTVLEFPANPSPVKFFVKKIDYQSQEIHLYDPNKCLSRQVLDISYSSVSPFQFKSSTLANISFFDCSNKSWLSCPILPIPSSFGIDQVDLVSCTKIRDFSVRWKPWKNEHASFHNLIWNDFVILEWLKPNCSKCEVEGKKCRLKNRSTQQEIECFPCQDKFPLSTVIIASGYKGIYRSYRYWDNRCCPFSAGTIGSVLAVLVIVGLFYIDRYYKMKGQDQDLIEKFLEDYRALKTTRFSYAEIKRITNGFKDNLGEGAHGAVFKGKLTEEIPVAVKILNNTDDNGEEFINEIGTMGKIHHVNVVRLLGFCADGIHRALVYDFFPNGSLQHYMTLPNNKDIFLGWEKLQQVAFGIARGIEYIHQGCDKRILHFDINPNNVLLDNNFTPKITDFGLAKLCPKSQSIVSMTATRGTLGYIAPEVFSRDFGNVSYKADVYSYGMLLLEIVGGRKNVHNMNKNNFQVLYPEWIHNLVEGGDVHINIEDEVDIQIAKKLAIAGLWCIQWHPVNRPSMKTIIQMLEGELAMLTVPPSPFDPTTSRGGNATNARPLSLELEVIHELE